MKDPEQGPLVRDRNRFVLVDSMRALAALSVVAFHATYRFPIPSGLWAYVSQRNAGPPITGVVLFFLISGFVLYRPFVKARLAGEPLPALIPYAVRRVARIVPAYWAALAIVTVWLGLHEVQSVHGVIRYFGFLQLYGNARTAGGGISPAWTLDVEVTFYAMLPLVAIAIRRVWRRRPAVRTEFALCGVLALVSLAWQAAICATVATSNGWKIPLLWSLPGSLDLFAAGMALAVASVAVARMERPPRTVRLVERMPWLPWLLALAVFYAVGRLPELSRYSFAAWAIPSHELKAVGCALLLLPVVFGAPNQGWLRRALAWRPLLWLGTISYGIYLWHTPLLTKLAPHLVHHGEVFTIAGLTAATVAVAALSYYLVERPSQALARRYLRGRRPARKEPLVVAALAAPAAAAVPDDPRA